MTYTKLLLTTGSTPRRLTVPGSDLVGVFTLRTVGDADALRAAISGGGSVVVIGGGWIGLETAAAARGYDAAVTIIEPQPTPLHAVLGPELGGFFGELHRSHGVDLRTGSGVGEILGAAGKVVGVVTSTGEVLKADAVIVGVGIRPNVELAEQAGLAVGNGIVVDAQWRTSDPDVFAAGDVASAHQPLFGRHVRVEHWANALNGGPAAARSMLGTGQDYDRVPYFYSDQYDVGMEYSGLAVDYDQVVIRGDRNEREFVAFWLKQRRVLAGMNVNVWDVTAPIQHLVRSTAAIDPARLVDLAVPLGEVATG